MSKTEPAFPRLWKDLWAKAPMPQRLPAGTIKRLNVLEFLDKTAAIDAASGKKLIQGLFEELGSLLGEGTRYWSPAVGYIDIYYPNPVAQAAELAHTVLSSAIERRIRGEFMAPARAGLRGSDAVERLVSFEQFQQICARLKATPDLVQTLDIGEIVFGEKAAGTRVSRRAWRMVDEILEDFLGDRGYAAHHRDDQVLLFFPGQTVGLAKLRRKAMIQEIKRGAAKLARLAEEPVAHNTQNGSAAPPARDGKDGEEQPDLDTAEIVQLNRSLAALAARIEEDMAAQGADQVLPDGVSLVTVPIWRAKTQKLVGYMMSASRAAEARHVPDPSLDIPLMIHALTQDETAPDGAPPYLTMFPLTWKTLERTHTRIKFFGYCASIPEQLRRYSMPVITGLPPDILRSRVDERVREVKRYFRALACLTDFHRRDFQQLKDIDLHAVGIDLSGAMESSALAALDGFLDAAAPLGMRTFAHGIPSKSLAIGALASGFDFLSGPVISDTSEVKGVKTFSISNLYAG